MSNQVRNGRARNGCPALPLIQIVFTPFPKVPKIAANASKSLPPKPCPNLPSSPIEFQMGHDQLRNGTFKHISLQTDSIYKCEFSATFKVAYFRAHEVHRRKPLGGRQAQELCEVQVVGRVGAVAGARVAGERCARRRAPAPNQCKLIH